MLNSAQRPSLTGYPLSYVHLLLFISLNSHDQLASGLVAQLVEQRWFVPEIVGSNPAGVRDFLLFLRVGSFPF